MSIMRASYRDDGGTATPATTIGPVINPNAGLTPRQLLEKYPVPVANGPKFEGETADEYNIRLQKWKHDNRWWTDVYGEPNVTPRTQAELDADEMGIEAGNEVANRNKEALGFWEDQKDPNSEYNQLLRSNAAADASGAYFGAGTPGSTRSVSSAAGASHNAMLANTSAAQRGLEGATSRLGQGADIMRGVGEGQHAYADTVQNAKNLEQDYYRGLGKQQGAADLGYLTSGEVTPPQSSNKGSNGWGAFINNPLFKAISSWNLAEGGSVPYYRDFGGAVGGGAAAMPQQGGGIVGAGMDLQNPVPQGMDIPNAMSNPGMPDQGMGLGATETPQGMGLGAVPTSTQGMGGMPAQGIAGAGMEPMPEPSMSMIEIDDKPKSELDMLEEQMIDAVAASGGDITITRKTTKRRSRK